jgi:hypothetical protein
MLARWIREGWRFRIIRRGDRRYITRLRNRVERSLGPYDDALWHRIQAMIAPQLHLGETIDALRGRVDELAAQASSTQSTVITDALGARIDQIEVQIAALRSTGIAEELYALKVERCPFTCTAGAHRYCSLYVSVRRPTEIMRQYPRVTFDYVTLENRTGWYFRAHPDLCTLCNPLEALLAPYRVPQLKLEAITKDLEVMKRLGSAYQDCALRVGNRCTYFSSSEKTPVIELPDASTGVIRYHLDVEKYPATCFVCRQYYRTREGSTSLSDIFMTSR